VESQARLAKLAPRELEVFEWLIAGLINKEIADYISLRSGSTYRPERHG
jgi:DNA-binding CsgD family transcriptional regulator